MLVGFWFANIGKVQNLARVQHRFGQRSLLGITHPFKKYGHQERRALIIGDFSFGHTLNKERDLSGREFSAVAFFEDDVLWSHQKLYSPQSRCGRMLRRKPRSG